MGFWEALGNPDIAFLRYAFIASLLGSVAFGVVGTYVVVRRISYIAGAISHCVLGGIGVALYLQTTQGWTWFDPLYGAILAALIASVLIGLISLRAREREDTVIGALWALGMAIGLLFLAKTPGYVDPMSYLFGNVLLLTRQDLHTILILVIVVIGVATFFYHKFMAVCFDEEFARLRGLRVEWLFLLLLCITALTVVLMVRVVGIVMVIALLTLPAAAASLLSKRLWHMMGLAILICAVVNGVGIGVSYSLDLPTGPSIIVLAGIFYLVITLVALWRKRKPARPS